jgi:hypothetical protein
MVCPFVTVIEGYDAWDMTELESFVVETMAE